MLDFNVFCVNSLRLFARSGLCPKSRPPARRTGKPGHDLAELPGSLPVASYVKGSPLRPSCDSSWSNCQQFLMPLRTQWGATTHPNLGWLRSIIPNRCREFTKSFRRQSFLKSSGLTGLELGKNLSTRQACHDVYLMYASEKCPHTHFFYSAPIFPCPSGAPIDKRLTVQRVWKGGTFPALDLVNLESQL